MNIGFDAFFLSMKENTGIGNVVLQLLRGLSGADDHNRYFLFTPGIAHQDIADEICKNRNFTVVIVRGAFSSSRRIWLQCPSLLRAVKMTGVEFFFGGGEYIPVFLPRRIAAGVIIHDCVSRLFPGSIPFSSRLLYRFLLPLCVRRADHIFTISQNSAEDIRRFYSVGTRPFHIIPNGVDLSVYHPGKKAGDGYILFVGTVQPRKNLAMLIRGFAYAADSIRERLVVVGASGWKNSDLSALVESLPPHTRERIEFRGYLSGEQLAVLYREAELFAAPSIHEGFGLILLEACASGTAVLASPTGAVPEFFSECAAFADPYSAGDIGRNLVLLLNSGSEREKMAKKGLALSARFSVEVMVRGYLRAFDSIAGKTVSAK
ncbi:MAG: glycosyltransferase family 4 protein [Spirochaetota bacterium]